MKFLSRGHSDDELAATATEAPEPTVGKGRPTPSRREAEAQRKQTLKVPSDPKEARKAARARAAAERRAERAAVLSGDEKHLPPRDAGPVKAFVRDYVDGRWAAAEFFLPMAIVVRVAGLLPLGNVQALISALWLFLTLFILVDTTLLMFRLSSELKKRWPADADRKGATFYAVMRVLQLRRLRLPRPRVRPGGKPVRSKAAKASKESATKGPAAKGSAAK